MASARPSSSPTAHPGIGTDRGRATLLLVGIAVVVGVVVAVGVGIFVDRVINANRIVVLDADPGDCFTLPIDPDLTELVEIERQDCAEPHDAEVVSVGELNPDGDRAYPDDELLFDLVDVACGDPRRYLDDGFGLLPVAPNERSWDRQQGRFVCVAVSLGGEPVSGSHFATRPQSGAATNGEESASG